MASFTLVSHLFLTALLIAINVAAIPPSFLLPVTSRQGFASCAADSDCSVSGCKCLLPRSKQCSNLDLAQSKLSTCTPCTTASDCPGDTKGCNIQLKRCQTCTTSAIRQSLEACTSSTTGSSGTTSSTGTTGTAGTTGTTETDGTTGTAGTAGTTDTTATAGTTGSSGTGGTLGKSCSQANPCVDGCTCNASDEGGPSVCLKQSVLLSKMKECAICTSDNECAGTTCNPTLKKCSNCIALAAFEASKACNTNEAKCFPSKALVRTRTRGLVPMNELHVGDEVLVGPQNMFSRVFMFTHRDTDVVSSFIEIQTSAGNIIRLTAGHMLYVNGALTRADDLKVGDSLVGITGSQMQVVRIGSYVGRGLYNPQTYHGDIIVDGIRTSTYTEAIAPKAAHALLAPFRAIESHLGIKSGFFEDDSSVVVRSFREMST